MSEKTYVNKFLIASPGMLDPNFAKTVVFIAAYVPERGAFGIVVNRPNPNVTLADVYGQLGLDVTAQTTDNIELGVGGPCQLDHGFMLLSTEKDWNGTLYKGTDIALSVSPDVIAAAAKGEGPNKMYVALGCAGWDVGQLESEIHEGAWYIADADPHIIFDLPTEQRYEAALARAGLDMKKVEATGSEAFLSSTIGHA